MVGGNMSAVNGVVSLTETGYVVVSVTCGYRARLGVEVVEGHTAYTDVDTFDDMRHLHGLLSAYNVPSPLHAVHDKDMGREAVSQCHARLIVQEVFGISNTGLKYPADRFSDL